MADKQRSYLIKINGVSESISQIDSLINKIDSLSQKIDSLNKKGVKIDTTVTSGGDAGQAQQVAQVQQQITIEVQKQNEALREQQTFVDATKQAESDVLQIANSLLGSYDSNIAKLDAINQKLAENKQAQKDVADALKSEAIDAESAAASRQKLLDEELRLKQARSETMTILKNEVKMNQANENSYDRMSQTLGRLRDALRAAGSGLSPEAFNKISAAIDKMDKELKEADNSVGLFSRNVGNYASAADGFQKITVTIAGVNKEFDSAKSAIMELKNAMAQLVMSGQQGTEAYKALENQMQNLQLAMVTVNDSIDRAKDASSGLHTAVEALQGLTAIAGIGQGLSSLFGIDDGALGEQIKKLTSLMAIMQGLQQLSTQMATGTGIGSALKKVLDISGINNDWKQFKDSMTVIGQKLGIVKVQAEGAAVGFSAMAASAKAAEAAVKGIGRALLIGFAIEAVVWAIELLVDGFKALYDVCHDWISMSDDVSRANKALETSLDSVADMAKLQAERIDDAVGRGVISEYDAIIEKQNVWTNAIAQTVSELKSVIDTQERAGNIHPQLADWEKINAKADELNKRMLNGEDVANEWNGLMSTVLNDIAARVQNLDTSDKEALKNFSEWISTAPIAQRAMEYFGDAGKDATDAVGNGFISATEKISPLLDKLFQVNGELSKMQNEFDTMLEKAQYWDKYGNLNQYNIDKANNRATGLAGTPGITGGTEANLALIKKFNEAQYREHTTANRKRVAAAKKTSNDLLQFEKNLQADKLAVMRDGLTKTLAIIEEERRARLEAINKSGVSEAKKEEARVAANTLYNQKALDAQKEYHEKYLKEERDFEARVLRETSDYANSSVSSISTDLDKAMNDLKKRLSEGIRYSAIPQMIDSKPISNEMKELYKTTLEAMAGFSQYESTLDLQLRKLMDDYKQLIDTFDEGQPIDEESVKKLNEYVAAIRSTRNEMAKLDEVRTELIKNNKMYGNIDNAFSFDVADNRKIMAEYYREIASQSVEAMTLYQDQHLQALLDKMKADRKEIANAAEDELNEFDKLWENRLKDQSFIDKEFGGDSEKATKHMAQKRNEIENLYRLKDQAAYREYLDEKNKAEIEALDKGKKIYEDFYTSISRLYTDANTSIMNKISGLPDIMKNAFGTFNLGDYKSKLKEAASEMDALRDEVRLSLEGIREDWLNGWMDDETFYRLEREFSGMRDTIDENMSQVRDKLSSANGEWWKGIDEWIQNIASSFQQVLSAIFEYQNGEFDRMQEAIDKELELVQKKYDEMEELAQQHKDAMNEIEDELSTARGDRRQHLIDALSSEIQAQREALAEKKKLEKQEQALKDKSAKIELQRKKQQRKQDIIQAILNGALAISQAATNRYPIPAIPLMALAASVTAAQVAIMSKTHYAKGGLLEGKSHAQGGIPVGNTGIEVEGNEFVTNKKTTMKNLDLLYYINSKKRRLDISDFIDFYTKNEKTRKPIISNRFADGGLTPNIDLAERLVNVVVERDNRPIYVSVVDIARAQDRLANVRELAGD